MRTGSMLLESKILPDRAYQMQEETLIVWTEDESMDLALSFQEKAGCNDVWAKLCYVRIIHVCRHVLMRRKEGRSKQDQTNKAKQRSKCKYK